MEETHLPTVSHWRVFADFVEAAGAGKALAPTFRDGLATDYVTDAILKSAKTRQWESVGK